ncbi:hypothetical protein [Paraburkholderia sp.]|jgi:hypothetical protein|uniref:hypothetical protein n=1 Tax=Paraburkholderia sp. TaxID=1926495 RepID=UPI002F3E8E54
MSTCPLSRVFSSAAPTSTHATAARQGRGDGRLWLAVLLGIAGLAGLYQIQLLLSAIPDSNDDFIYF